MSEPGASTEDAGGTGPWVPDPYPERALIMHLEPDQLVAETYRPVAPARLARRTLIGLWTLRLFAVVVGLMVIYTFIARLQ